MLLGEITAQMSQIVQKSRGYFWTKKRKVSVCLFTITAYAKKICKFHIEIVNIICYYIKVKKQARVYAPDKRIRKCKKNKEKVMRQQDQQTKKVKLYRTLKVLFYFLGLPLFIFAVFITAIRFLGNDPFGGTSNFTSSLGFLMGYEQLFTSHAMLGVWLAFAVWLVISIIHLILSKTVKSRRVRMFAVVAVCLVVLLGGSLVMDAVFDAQITSIQENAPDGVVVDDYKTQLSYYRRVSANKAGEGLTDKLIDQVEQLCRVYNVQMGGIDKRGTAGNTANKPITYYNVIDDEGNIGVDISFKLNSETGLYALDVDPDGNQIAAGDGEITKDVEGKQLVRLMPDGSGNLVINGTVYSHYFYVERAGSNGTAIYEWYAKDLMPEFYDGVYGEGYYNESGLFSDGYIPGLNNVLSILEQYYEAQAAIAAGEALQGPDSYTTIYPGILADAAEKREQYYKGEIPDPDTGEYADEWLQAYYTQDADLEARFSITRPELDALIAQVGALLGDNSLFDLLFVDPDALLDGIGVGSIVSGFLHQSLSALIGQLNDGMSLTTLITSFGGSASTAATAVEWIGRLTGHEDLKDAYIVFSYKSWNATLGSDKTKIKPNLFLAVVAGDPAGPEGESHMYDATDPANVLLDVDMSKELLGEEDGNPDYAFDLDHLSAFLNLALNKLVSGNIKGTVDTVINLLKQLNLLVTTMDVDGELYTGIEIAGIKIPLINAAGQFDIDVNGILMNLLKGYYSYQSIAIKPVWEFYTWYDEGADENYMAAAWWYQQFQRAEYEAVVYSNMIGSTILGDNLGDGSYPASFGISDLTAIRQLQTDLSYQPVYFPLFGLRDMMLIFSGIVVLFYFLSFVAAEKEEQYATGKAIGKERQKELIEEIEGHEHAHTTAAPIGTAGVVSAGAHEVAEETPVTHKSASEIKAEAEAIKAETEAVKAEIKAVKAAKVAQEKAAVPVKAKSDKGVK